MKPDPYALLTATEQRHARRNRRFEQRDRQRRSELRAALNNLAIDIGAGVHRDKLRDQILHIRDIFARIDL